MFLLTKFLSAVVLPPIGPVLLALFGFWLTRRRPRLGRALIALGLGALLLLSMPWTADALLRNLEDAPPIARDDLAEVQAIVILAGGKFRDAPEYGGDTVNTVTLERLRYGARLARESGLPVAVAGGAPSGGVPEGELMQEALATDFGLTARWVETRSLDTVENAEFLAPLLKNAGIGRIALVTHAWHMRRARAAFENYGLEVVPAPTSFLTERRTPWLPSTADLGRSRVALHEWMGILAAETAETIADR